MGIWPPSDLIANSMYPYIKRISNQVSILDVGTEKGENAYRFLELDTKNKKIDIIFTVKTTEEHNELIDTNLKEHYGKVIFAEPKEPVDLVCINSNTDLDRTLNTYYSCVKSNGIFCGNNHSDKRVKEALTKFRRVNKIGTPILVAHDIFFWYKR